ncbi:MAG: YdeI/OmpD-associated family protein [Pseudomonadota bacterium]
MTNMPNYPRVEVTSAPALWDWLAAHHGADGALLVTWKAAHRAKYVSREEVLDALVAFGWIDGRRYKVDADRTAQLITPRRTQAWAQSYKDRAARLEAQGRMMPPGAASVAAGKAGGLWEVMAEVDRLKVPDDLDAALGPARTAWDALAPSYRRNVLRWVAQAKTDPTRIKRVRAAAEATAAGQKLPQM